MNMTPYFDYLREKYAALYRLPVSFGGDSGTLPIHTLAPTFSRITLLGTSKMK